MPDSTSVRPILEAAEQAASAGNLDAAGELLRQTVQLQEAELGPQHPDLANTLNNLGVVCEKTGRLDEAAACYRRAYEIAAASFEPDHPFVITSRKNLVEFGEAHGVAIEPPTAPVSAASASPPPPETVSPPRIEAAAVTDTRPAATHRWFPVAIPVAAIGLLAVLVFGVMVTRRSNEPAASPEPRPSPAASTPSDSEPGRDGTPTGVAPASADSANASKEAAPPSTTRDDSSVPSRKPGSARAAAQPTVGEAKVCSRFSTAGSPDWRCDRAGSSVTPGSLVYYTRIKAATATTVEHRWYHGDDLQQKVLLDVAANPTAGYRTYSRLAVTARGTWRVELRTTSGALLHEERFNVR